MKNYIAFLSVLSTLFYFCYSQKACAEVKVEGRGEVAYETGVFSDKPDAETHQRVIVEAEKAAIARYASSFASAKFDLFQKVSAEIYGQIDQYVIDAVVIDEGYRPDANAYYAVIRASINDAKLDAKLNNQGVQNNARLSGGASTTVSYLFVARETDSRKVFNERHTQISSSQSSLNATQEQELSGGKAKYTEDTERALVSSSGGNTLHKADDVKYRVTSPENLNTSMTDVLSSKGFQVYDYRDVVNQCGGADPAKIYTEFAKADELSRDIRGKVFAAAKQCEISSFAFGTLDVGIADIDPVTGNKRVFVSVRSQIMDLTGKLPRIVASVGPVQYSGLGPDQDVATKNALRLASAEAAKTIADQLNAKGLR